MGLLYFEQLTLTRLVPARLRGGPEQIWPSRQTSEKATSVLAKRF